jgi:regulator of protease activity HflC (stomatin/prohibitin superfamily)
MQKKARFWFSYLGGTMEDTLTTIFTVAALGVPALTALGAGLFTNDEKQDKLITRFGKHIRTVDTPGLKFKIPLLDKVESTIDTDLRAAKIENLQFRGSDKQFFTLPVVIQYRVTDSAKYVFETDDPEFQMNEIVTKAVRSYCAGKDYDELLTEKDDVDVKVKEEVTNSVAELGITIHKVMINDPDVDESVKKAYNNLVTEQLKRQAKVTQAEGDKEVETIRGQAAASYRQESVKGYPEMIKMFEAAGIDPDKAMQFVQLMATLDNYSEMAKSGNAILLPAPQNGQKGTDMADMMVAMRTVLEQGQNGTTLPQVKNASKPAP